MKYIFRPALLPLLLLWSLGLSAFWFVYATPGGVVDFRGGENYLRIERPR